MSAGYGAGGTLIGQGTYQGLCIPARPIDVPAGTTFVDVQGGLHQSIGLDSTGHVTWGESPGTRACRAAVATAGTG